MLSGIIIILILVFLAGGLYALSGRISRVRSFVAMCFPERFLPDLIVPGANYGLIAASIDDDEDLQER
jgi:hypothetical protein